LGAFGTLGSLFPFLQPHAIRVTLHFRRVKRGVLSQRHGFEVVWVDARSIPTDMVQKFVLAEARKLVSKDVSTNVPFHMAIPYSKNAVPVWTNVPSPKPATIGTFRKSDPGPELVFKWFSRSPYQWQRCLLVS